MRKILAALSLVVSASLVSFAVAKDTGAEVGSAAPAFTLEDHEGKKVSLADFKDKIVVIEWINPSCPFVVRHYKAKTQANLSTKYAEKGVVWLAINSTKDCTNEANKAWVAEHGLNFKILNDASGEIGHAYGAKTTPHMFVVDKTGKIAYAGAMDDDADGKKGDKRVNHIEAALEDLLAGKAVRTPSSKPYGCSVKFKA